MLKFTFGFKDFHDLNDDLRASRRAIPLIVQRVMSQEFRQLRNELRPQIPAKTGGIRRHFSSSVRRGVGSVTARLGFIARTTQRTAIAANVMQHGSNVRPKSAAYLWIPLPANRQADGSPVTSPREVRSDRKRFFVGRSRAGNLIAFLRSSLTPLFVLKKAISVKARPIPFEDRVIQNQPATNRKIENAVAAVLEAKKRAQSIQE